MKTTRTPFGSADLGYLGDGTVLVRKRGAFGTSWWRATRAWPSAERRPSMDTSRSAEFAVAAREQSRAREDNGCKGIHGSSHLKLVPHGWLLRDMRARLIARTLRVIVDYAKARDLFVRCRNCRSRIVNCWERGRLRFRGRCWRASSRCSRSSAPSAPTIRSDRSAASATGCSRWAPIGLYAPAS